MPTPAVSVLSTRRSFLGLIGAAATMPVFGGTATAAATATRPRRGEEIDFVSVHWTGPRAPRIQPVDGSRAGQWIDVSASCSGGRDGRHVHRSSALVAVPGASLSAVDASGGGEVWTRPVTTTATASLSLAAASARLASRTYLARPNWGADESLRIDANGVELYPQTYWPVQTLTVHHTATANDDPDPAATVRAIYADHLSPEKDFGDIGYHLLIDELGRVFEGRYSGEDVFPAHDPTGELMVNAAHVGGFNAGNIGVALLGDFTTGCRPPGRGARSCASWLCSQLGTVSTRRHP